MLAPQLRGDSHAFIVRLVDTLRALADPVAVQTAAARLLGVHLGVNRASYSEIDGDTVTVRGRYVNGVAPLPERLSLAAFGDVLVGESRRGRTVAIDDIRTDPRVSDAVRAAFDAIGIRSVVSVVLLKSGTWVAALGVDSVKPRAWTADERDLVREVAERTWAATEQVRAEAALRESEARHRRLFESMGEGFAVGEVIRDACGTIVDWRYRFVNAALERLSGLRPEDLVGRRGSAVFGAEHASWLPILADVVDGQRPRHVERPGAPQDRIWSIHVFPYGDDRYAALYDDVTTRRQAEEALRRSEARQAYLLRLADALRPLREAEAICYEAACVLGVHLRAARAYYADIDADRDVIDVARNWTRDGTASIAGRLRLSAFAWIQRTYAQGRTVAVADAGTSDMIPDEARPAVVALGVGAFIVAPLVKDGRLVAALSVTEAKPREWTPDEMHLVEETAERTWSAVERARAETALQQANDELEQRVRERTAQIQTLFGRLVSAQEEERRRIAREIHDQLGQQLTALRMHLDALHDRADAGPDMRGQVARTQRLAQDLDHCVDFLTWQLRPSTLDDLGLAAALREFVRGWGESFGIAADFESTAPPDLRLAPDVESHLFRLTQEALHNVVKHAAARHVSVVLSRRDDHAMLVIEDDGRGFEAAAADAAGGDRGFGLISMRERVALVGGELEIESTPGHGTSIFVRVPMG